LWTGTEDGSTKQQGKVGWFPITLFDFAERITCQV